VLIEAGDAFFEGEAPPLNYFRLGYSAISSESIPEGVARLAVVMRTLKP
jgi:GntR family transcriptional regulator/MocR family aminotransferase